MPRIGKRYRRELKSWMEGCLRTSANKGGGFLSAWRLPVTDDAGRKGELLSMQAQPSGTPRLDRVRDRTYLVYGEMTDFGRMLTRTVVLIVPMAVVVAVAMIWLRPKGVPTWAIGTIVGAFTTVGALVQTRRTFYRLAPRANEVADAYLDEGICPCCAYNLSGAVVALDAANGGGLVRCAECGASWRRDRIRRISTDDTAASRESINLRTVLRANAMVYCSMAFKDDAGRAVSLARYSDLKRLRTGATGRHREKLTRALRRLRFRGLWLRLLFASIVLPISIGIIVEFARLPVGAFGLMHGVKALGLVLWLIGIVAIVGSDIGRSGPERAALLKELGLCPACGAEVGGDAKGGRGVGSEGEDETCGECRAVWNMKTVLAGTIALPPEAR